MTATLVLGSGNTTLNATGELTVDPTGESILTIDMGNDKRSEKFLFRSGRPHCTITSSRFYPNPVDSGVCGSPIPWFCPSFFLSKLSANSFIASSAVLGGTQVITLTQRRIAPGTERDPANAWPTSFSFTSAGLLSNFSYRISLRSGSPQYLDAVIEYSDYRQTSFGQLPFHIRQTIDGSISIDLTITSVLVGVE
jgi:hypothetical protein